MTAFALFNLFFKLAEILVVNVMHSVIKISVAREVATIKKMYRLIYYLSWKMQHPVIAYFDEILYLYNNWAITKIKRSKFQ
jgi:hypothetical protein